VPTYLQLVQQVEHALRLGYLKPGDQLPKVRDAVASLAINPNTVLKAYKELETKGLAVGRPGQGTFVQALANLDPLARHDFMATVLAAAAEDGMSVMLSSHVLSELERVADYLILVSGGRVQVTGEVDDLLATHRVLTGPAAEAELLAERLAVVHARRAEAQAHLLVRTSAPGEPVPHV
jgi:DNA-binding transcriptional regulator YhcF (GntR family)